MTTDLEVRMTIKTLARKGIPKRDLARQLNVSEDNIRYHLCRIKSNAVDERSRQQHKAAGPAGPIDAWLGYQLEHGAAVNLTELHGHLVAEHDYN